ncbi:hypothetical protein Mapa_007898 [Marchantia paleacea]|nr:hypothetical protein Mapa_007898 [Marchantia paleacea]
MEDRIEGAGASIVSHAAALETQGMDAVGKTDEEAELSVALQKMIQRLEGKAWRGSSHFDGPKMWGFLHEACIALDERGVAKPSAPPSDGGNWQLQHHYNCGSLLQFLWIWASEWEVVSRGVKFSSVLERL